MTARGKSVKLGYRRGRQGGGTKISKERTLVQAVCHTLDEEIGVVDR